MKLIKELVRSEETHVESLQNVILEYLGPLKEKKILAPVLIKNLFGNIELILSWNMNFLHMLKERLKNTDCFGDLVINMSVILRQLFTQYNENYSLAQKTYTECLKNKEFEQLVQKNQAKSKSNLLTSLYLPIQRMIMYDSLLKDIIVLTPRTHRDFDTLCTAYKLLRSMDKAANRVVEKRKNLDTVIKIQNSLIDEDVYIAQPHRSYVFQEDLILVVGKQEKARTMYLFNDIVLIAKPRKKNKYQVHVIIPLDRITVDEMEGDPDDRHLFKLIPKQRGTTNNNNDNNNANNSNTTIPNNLNTTTNITTNSNGPVNTIGIPNANSNYAQEYVFYSADKASWIQLLHSTIKKLHLLPPEVSDLKVEDQDHAQSIKEGKFEKHVALMNDGNVLITQEMLMKKIKRWSEMKDLDALVKDIKKMAKKIEKFEELKENWNGRVATTTSSSSPIVSNTKASNGPSKSTPKEKDSKS
eukprot:TRINITY_DN7016_c0_g1_i1.p1 TRINITY_DN7016_c0_g1~~TRINITY_DN7016_c0_g1_i1.p1  ORF type:complete len:470 (-),score=87.12 TRINITY_DN7016_c0_g1_i1:43-1452(-)